MSLIGALNIGKSALAVQQAALQVTGNNIANAGNADYTRQTSSIVPNRDQQISPGVFLGTGVNLTAVQRQIDEALQSRLRSATSDSMGASAGEQWISRIEAIFNELSDQDLSTQLSAFFTSWSSLANKPQDVGLRQVVIQSGQAVASWFQQLRGQMDSLLQDLDARQRGLALDANSLAQQVADLNSQIVLAEAGGRGQANGLRDQRDMVLGKLAELMDIRTVDTGDGMINVLVGSEPLVIGTDNRGVRLREGAVDGQLVATPVFQRDGGTLQISSGQMGALSGVREQINSVIQTLDSLASNLIFELNKLHASGQGLSGYSSTTANHSINSTTAALSSEAAGLDHVPSNGSFVLHVRQKATGLVSSTLVQVDLDGLNGDDTTLQSLRDDIDAIDGISASINAGKLTIRADGSDIEFTFSQDTSGVLAGLGVNTFFTGSTARDIAVSQAIVAAPTMLAAARNGEQADNQTALAIAALESLPLSALSGVSLKDSYQQMVNTVAVSASGAKTNSEASRILKETLQAQREALSGVSLDEEAVNLMRQQRALQGAARLIAAVDELMRTLLQLV